MERSLNSDEREALARMAAQPTAVWIASPKRLVKKSVEDVVSASAGRGAVATLVAYNIPNRDCGSYSASSDSIAASDYREWMTEFVAGLGSHKAIVVLEPDAIAQWDCLDEPARAERVELLRFAVEAIAAQGSWVYLDAGHSDWLPAKEAASRLREAGIQSASGFSLNVSNFNATDAEIAYGTAISDDLDDQPHFVIDTSRNGRTPETDEWCNPPGAGLGETPTVSTASPLVDAYLWIKTPGNSDGPCNGGPPAGEWFSDYALELARNAKD